MTIPETQLQTWSHQGSITQSSSTYNSIKTTLDSAQSPYRGKSYSIFLQGSYGNDTNIYAESDVDIVIKLDDCWQSDLSELTAPEKEAYQNAFPNATYTHVHFKRDVINVLKTQYSTDVQPGNKAIMISDRGNRRKADVIPAIQFRGYYKFKSKFDQNYDEGICFYNASNEKIANYPKQHSDNLSFKHQKTNEWLKPVIRIFKNARSKLIEEGRISKDTAPSYFIEGLIYNVPAGKFSTSYQNCFQNIIQWLQTEADKDKLLCANEQYYLVRENTHNCWPNANFESFVGAVKNLWDTWR